MSDSIDILPSSASHDDLLAWLPGFIGKKTSLELECLCSFCGDGDHCSLNDFYGLLVSPLGGR
jgi:hypothetical protein